ncbi:MAG: hypothetical protein KJ072_28875 [Verrucomicrobia bacterium]|nr:hypothetical protein [Verrucomicrobiota bacterium]
MNTTSLKHKCLTAVVVAGVVCLVAVIGLLVERWRYPYGRRAACLPMMTMGLTRYAAEHDGWLPKGGITPLASLQQLYPRYVEYAGHFAGLTGDIDLTRDVLVRGGTLTSNLSSWCYIPGFHEDEDPPVAVLWDRVDGLRWNAMRAARGSQAVGFSDGSQRQVSAEEWPVVLKSSLEARARRDSEVISIGLSTSLSDEP